MGDVDTSNTWSLGRAHPSPEPKGRRERLISHFPGLTAVTDRPTDQATRSVTVDRIYVGIRSRPMQ